MSNYVSKGIKNLYLNSADFAKYTDLQFAIADSIKLRPLENAKKTKAFKHLIATVSQNTVVHQIEKLTLQKALSSFEGYTQMAMNNQQLSEIIFGFLGELPDKAEQNALIAVISSSLAESWQWGSAKTQSRIILGAMLCDIALKEIPDIARKKKADMSKEESKIYEDHPFIGYKILSSVGGVPEEILQITLQHHENGIGAGFPQKLLRQKVHSFAKLIHGVQEFVGILVQQKDPTNISLALDHLFKFQRKIVSEQIIKGLYILFNKNVPKELETLLLPDKSGRLI